MDRCRVWESHADPIVHRMTKPTPDLTYPTYAVGNADKDREVIKVAVVTGVRSDQNQLQDLLRRIVLAIERPTPTPEISDIKKLLLQLTRVPPDGPAPVLTPQCRRHWNRYCDLSSMDNTDGNDSPKDSDSLRNNGQSGGTGQM